MDSAELLAKYPPRALTGSRAAFVFDWSGTLWGGELGPGELLRLLRKLRAGGHYVVIWSGGTVPEEWAREVNAVWRKGGSMKVWDQLQDCQVVYVDDDPALVQAVKRYVSIREDLELLTLDPADLSLLAA